MSLSTNIERLIKNILVLQTVQYSTKVWSLTILNAYSVKYWEVDLSLANGKKDLLWTFKPSVTTERNQAVFRPTPPIDISSITTYYGFAFNPMAMRQKDALLLNKKMLQYNTN